MCIYVYPCATVTHTKIFKAAASSKVIRVQMQTGIILQRYNGRCNFKYQAQYAARLMNFNEPKRRLSRRSSRAGKGINFFHEADTPTVIQRFINVTRRLRARAFIPFTAETPLALFILESNLHRRRTMSHDMVRWRDLRVSHRPRVMIAAN